MTQTIPATLISGDGIGPEIMSSVTTVMKALDAPFVWEHHAAGMGALEAEGKPYRNRHLTVCAVQGLP